MKNDELLECYECHYRGHSLAVNCPRNPGDCEKANDETRKILEDRIASEKSIGQDELLKWWDILIKACRSTGEPTANDKLAIEQIRALIQNFEMAVNKEAGRLLASLPEDEAENRPKVTKGLIADYALTFIGLGISPKANPAEIIEEMFKEAGVSVEPNPDNNSVKVSGKEEKNCQT